MALSDIIEKLSRIGKGNNPKIEFSEEGFPYVFSVVGIGLSGFEVKAFSPEGDEVLTLAGGKGEDCIIDKRKNDVKFKDNIIFDIYHMCKSRWFYEKDKSHESHNNYMLYRNRLLNTYKNFQ